MDSLGDCLSVTKNARCYGLIVVAAQYNVQYLCFQHLKNVEGVELPSFDDLVKLKHDPGLSSVKRTILGAGHYSEHIARWMRYYNAKQVSPVYMQFMVTRRLFPSSKNPRFQSEAMCKKRPCENEFYLHENRKLFSSSEESHCLPYLVYPRPLPKKKTERKKQIKKNYLSIVFAFSWNDCYTQR